MNPTPPRFIGLQTGQAWIPSDVLDHTPKMFLIADDTIV
jgi:hypothetical protein